MNETAGPGVPSRVTASRGVSVPGQFDDGARVRLVGVDRACLALNLGRRAYLARDTVLLERRRAEDEPGR